MDEIVPADQPSSSTRPPPPPPPPRAAPAEPFDSEKLPQTLVSEVRPFLRVANQIESESPRVAYLCRFHAFERAHIMDPHSTGRGVRQFKTSLLQRLEQDDKATTRKRKEKSDARELQSFYHKKKLMNAHEIIFVLSDVMKAVLSGAGPEVLAAGEHIEERPGSYHPYNILPLDPGGSQQAIMLLPEIKAAVSAVRSVRGLPASETNQSTCTYTDLFDWLQCWFGFQKGNVANQREHLILLLANIHVRHNPKSVSISKLDDRSVNELMMKIFRNYMNWCKFLGRKSNLLLPYVKQEVQQYKILYIALYLLIWGEASNLRLMPECLCYIFHHMAYELYGVLTGAVSLNTGEKVVPAYGGGSESFLENVITPLYRVIYEEAWKNKDGTADHSTWRNYDDLNEFFWSVNCFKLGWPMRLDNDFFCTLPPADQMNNSQVTASEAPLKKWPGKTNFVEIRSFWHIFRSFDRMWTFLLLALQAMIIMAWHGVETPLQVFDLIVFEDIITIFITKAVLRLIQVILDIAFTWKARHTMNYYDKQRFVFKFFFAATWSITLSCFYATSQTYSACSTEQFASNLDKFCLSPYMIVVIIYLMANVVGIILFLVPAVSSFIETSNWQVCNVLSWWAQVSEGIIIFFARGYLHALSVMLGHIDSYHCGQSVIVPEILEKLGLYSMADQEPRLFVGRGMQEGLTSILKYTVFWAILLSSKFLFSYHFEIKPLVEPTKLIMKVSVNNYDWHELFPEAKSNAGAILALWTPIILVYFMDTQIWYSIFCTFFGGFYGIIQHLGEIRTMGMVRSRFHSLPSVFRDSLVHHSSKKEKNRNLKSFLHSKIFKNSEIGEIDLARFSLVWNQIISSFRLEDLVSNREMDLMIMPLSPDRNCAKVKWPLFLLATKFSTALNMARDFVGKYEHLYRKMKKDCYMFYAVKECYDSLKIVFSVLVTGDLEKRVVDAIFNEIETSIRNSSLLEDFNMSELPNLHDKFIQLIEILFENKRAHRDRLIIFLQDILEILMKDMMTHGCRILDMINCSRIERDNDDFRRVPELFASVVPNSAICFPLPDDGSLKKQVKRLFLLLTVKDKAMDIPTNLEARRRISFFATSLFMDMPTAPKVRNMLSFSVMTPYYTEEVIFSEEDLHSTEDGASILSYMQKIHPDEWKNFLERINSTLLNDEMRYWASYRGQTLSRTVRGMMNYRKALKLQAFLDMANNQDILKGRISFERDHNKKNGQQSLSAQLDALVDMKFTYVISCQEFGNQKSCGDPHAQDIIDMMIRYPSLRVAYVEEKEEIIANKPHKVYSSVLVKADNGLDQEIYRIKLPGPPIIGEGKPENQNHAIIFTRGDALQTIDMNQDNYLEEALKMRNLLQEFLKNHGEHHPTILGLREHIFTGSVSSLAGFMSYQETSFVTIGQRFLANPLRVRFHYGHPDLFDRIFHLTRGGISKASRTINLSEDVFAGFNSTLRRGYITYNEYMQVGKGRDVGLNQISKFEAKVANGNSEQAVSRDIFRLGRRFDFFRMLSFYFTTVGFYFNSLISILGVYVFLYGQLYLVLSGLEKALLHRARMLNIKSLETALASQSFLQLGLLTGLPMVMELALEKGFRVAVSDFILMQLQLASVFFTFSLGTKAHYFGRTILHGGAKYRPTGRKFVVFHASFTENYQLYSRSHFIKGFELLFLLIVYNLFRRSTESSMAYMMTTYSIWFMALTWLAAPFLFNPNGFVWRRIVEDWREWIKWMNNQGGIGVPPEKSWESWWNAEYAHLRHSVLGSRILEIILSLRFFLYQYGLVYHLDISQENKNIVVYFLSWSVIIAIFLLVKAVNEGRKRLSVNYHIYFRIFKLFLFLGVVSGISALTIIYQLSLRDLIICCLAFLPTGWGLLSIAQVLRPKIEEYRIWDSVLVIAQAYDYGMGSLLFLPIATLAWMPVISAIQTRVLFNQAFSRQLQIHPILPGKSKKR